MSRFSTFLEKALARRMNRRICILIVGDSAVQRTLVGNPSSASETDAKSAVNEWPLRDMNGTYVAFPAPPLRRLPRPARPLRREMSGSARNVLTVEQPGEDPKKRDTRLPAFCDLRGMHGGLTLPADVDASST